MKTALKTGFWLIVVAWAIFVACIPGGQEDCRVISPAAGDVWQLGETQVIRWEQSDCKGIATLFLMQNGNQWSIASTYPSNLGDSYTWQVGALMNGKTASPGSNYKIYAGGGYGSTSGYSGVFTIGPRP